MRDEPQLDPEQVQALAQRFDLDAGRLAEALQTAARSYVYYANWREIEATPKERARYIETVRRAADTLVKKIQSPPLEVSIELGNLNSLQGELAQLIESLEQIAPQGTRPSKTKTMRDLFISVLERLWNDEKGAQASYTTDGVDSERGGKFIEFLTAAAQLCGIEHEPLAERYVRMTKERRTAPPFKVKLPPY